MIFLTGVPGFLGTRLLRSLAAAQPASSFCLLVQPKFEARTQSLLADLDLADRTEVLAGDITAPDLGLGGRYDDMAGRITKAVHLAAVYDLTIPRDVAWRVNVDGTRHVLDLLAESPNLEWFGYISSAYVSGERTGTIREDELVHDAGFKNFYEESKYHAEVIVQDRMDEIPTLVFRPSIVVGDSETGETDKFDGPYFVLNALRTLPRYTLMTRVGSGTEPVNLVPADFVIEAMVHLMSTGGHEGAVFHLTDPRPLTAQALMELFADLLDMHVAYVPVPPSVARGLMNTGVGRVLGIAPELIDYFDHPSRYDASNTQAALGNTSISCPAFPTYAPTMVEYARRHQARSAAMY
jgi:thioester reductase-like protein